MFPTITHKRLVHLKNLCGIWVMVTGLAVLIGWWQDIPHLIQVHKSFQPMNPLTAWNFLITGAALLISNRCDQSKVLSTLLAACCIFVMTVSAIRIMDAGGLTHIGIDHIIFTDKVGHKHMAPTTALNFLLISCGLLGLNFSWTRKILPPEIVAIPPLLLVSLALIGYSFDMVYFQKSTFFIPIAIHTVINFWILCAGIILTPYPGSITTRMLMESGPVRIHKFIFRICQETPMAWIVLVISILLTAVIWQMSRSSMRQVADINFNMRCKEIDSSICGRIDSCTLLLNGARGLFHASERVTFNEWTDYAKSLHLKTTMPELKGIGYVSYVKNEDLQKFLSFENKGRPVPLTFPHRGNFADYFIVNYFEPLAENKDLPGNDFGQDPRRRRVMERAYATDTACTTPVLQLTDEPSLGFNIFLPVYQHKVKTLPDTGHPGKLEGWVFGVFRMNDLMQKVKESSDKGIRFVIFDGSESSPDHKIYESHPLPYPSDVGTAAAFHTKRKIYFPGHEWTVEFSSLPAFEQTFSDRQSAIILNAGLALSVLLFGVTWSLGTTRARAEEIAQKMTEELKIKDQAFASVSNGIVIADAGDKDMPIIYVNEAFTRITGYAAEEAIGKNCRFLQNDDREQPALRGIRQALKSGTPCRAVVRNYRKDGTLFYNELSISPIKSTDGRILYFVGIQQDITERKTFEKHLEESERKYRTVVNSVQEVIFQMDIGGHWTFLSAAWQTMTGYSEKDSLGQSFLRNIHPLDRTMVSENFRNLLTKATGSFRLEARVLSRDGHHLWTDFYILKRPGVKDEPLTLSGTIMDITERKRAEEMTARARDAAMQSARMKADFLANMSHEIRTPLNGIVGMAGLLSDTNLGREQRDFVQTIRTCADSLLGIINDILDFSKIEAGKLSFETLDFNLRNAVENSLDMVASGISSPSIELAYFINDDVPVSLRGDPGRLKQILVNLISNAVKFTQKGEVVITLSLESMTSGQAVIRTEVRDTGIGIASSKLKELFQPFVQADTSTTRKYGGTGLGLSISRQLTIMMGGDMGVTSTLGQGSTFWFTLPFELQERPHPALNLSGLNLKGVRVLVLDDNETNRRILFHQLTKWQLHVDVIGDPAATLDTLINAKNSGNPYQLLLLDMQMPSLDGLDVAKAIQSHGEFDSLSILLMTSGSPTRRDVTYYQSFGIRQCLTKPVKQSALLDHIASLLDFPLSPVTTPAAKSPDQHESPSEKKPFRILIAEDNITNQKVALLQLAKLGYEADAVANGLEALDALERIPYKIILMDCQMPEMDGYQASSRIRMNAKAGYRPVIIAMTAHAMEGDEKKCLAAGMDDYISKPVNINSLRLILDKWTRKITH